MKIICAGFRKTGTKSLAHALRILGYKVYDYDDQIMNLLDFWAKFLDGTVTDDDIRDAFKDIDVIIDGPTMTFWDDIHRAIPEVKVILTIRDEDSWWRSYKNAVRTLPLKTRILYTFSMFLPTGRKIMKMGHQMNTLSIGVENSNQSIFHLSENPRLYKFAFRRHNSHVIEAVPKSKLLIYPVGAGWGPLCNFLGKDVPGISYPHKNRDGAHFKSEGGAQNPQLKKLLREAGVVVVVLTMLVFVIMFLVFYYLLM